MSNFQAFLIIILSLFLTSFTQFDNSSDIAPAQDTEDFVEESIPVVEPYLPSGEEVEEYKEYIKNGDLYLTEQNYVEARKQYEKAYNVIVNYDANELLMEYYLKQAKLDYRDELPASAIMFLQTALNIAENLELKLSIAEIFTELSYILYDNFDYHSAENYLKQAAIIYKEEKYKADYAKAAYNLSIIYKKLDDEINEQYFFNEYRNNKSAIKSRFYMFSENIDNIPYYIDLTSNFARSKFYESNFVILKILNKITAKTYDFRVLIGSKLKFQTIEIRPHACWTALPQEIPENKALISVYNVTNVENTKIYNGWFLSSTPSVSTFEHPFYDLILVGCIGKE